MSSEIDLFFLHLLALPSYVLATFSKIINGSSKFSLSLALVITEHKKHLFVNSYNKAE